MQSSKTWTIGRMPENDICVPEQGVSSEHAKLYYDHGTWKIEDLGSTNGTFIDGVAITARVPVTVGARSKVTLGTGSTFRWPRVPTVALKQTPAASDVIRIGRAPENDVVIDLPTVSREHAVITRENDQFFIEDLHSSNGVAVNVMDNLVRRAAIQPSDSIFLGSYKIPASQILGTRHIEIGEAATEVVAFEGSKLVLGRDPQCDQSLSYPVVSWHHASLTKSSDGIYVEDLGSKNGTFVNGRRISSRTKVQPGDQIGLGSYRFQLQDSGSLVRREYHGNVTIEASDMVVEVGNGKRLIEPASFTIYPSEFVALMGPAGAGKTTLLKALNGYTPPSKGDVLFNGASLYKYYDLFRLQMGYVPQDDIIHSQLTVAEALHYSVKLRTDLNEKEIDERINTVLSDLGILDKKHTLIGSPERKVLSGGQRKRVNIALELIHDTPVLFLDEPTSGLSSYDAEGVIRVLKNLSRSGKTVITTIHQPSLDVFREFDDLIMMSRDSGDASSGSMVFFGPAFPDSIRFFNPSNAEIADKDMNPEMVLSGLAKQNTAAWDARYHESKYQKQFVEDRRGTQPERRGEEAERSAHRAFDLKQWLALTKRNATCKLRDRGQTMVLLIQAPIFALLLTAVVRPFKLPFSHAALSGEDLMKRLVITHFLMVVAAIWFGCNNAARDIVGEWSIYQRERMVSLKLPSYIFSKLTVLFVVGVFQMFVMLTIVYFGSDKLRGDFLTELAVLVLATMIGASIGLCISARASTTESAIALLPVVLLPVIALGGGLQPTYRLPTPVQWAAAVVPSRWAFEANIITEGKEWDAYPVKEEHGVQTSMIPPAAQPNPWAPCPVAPAALTDAVAGSVPTYYQVKVGDCAARPALRYNADHTENVAYRPTLQTCLTILAGMLSFFVLLSLTFLKVRDIQ